MNQPASSAPTQERSIDLLDGQDQVAVKIFEATMESTLESGHHHSMDLVSPTNHLIQIDRLTPAQLDQLIDFVQRKEYKMLVGPPVWMEGARARLTTTRLIWVPERQEFQVQ